MAKGGTKSKGKASRSLKRQRHFARAAAKKARRLAHQAKLKARV